VPYGRFFALSGLGYAGVALFVRSERTQPEFAIFLVLFGVLGALWWRVAVRVRRPPPSLPVILLGSFFLRLLLIPAGYDVESGRYRRLILYDDDVWRYLWEGHAWSAGVDPMRVSPRELEEYQLELDDPEKFRRLYAQPFWTDVWDNIGYREIASPYPAAAHGVFRLAHWLEPGGVAVFKLLMTIFDLGAIWLLAAIARALDRPPRAAAIYGWCPLPIKEFAGSGHVDAVMIFLLLLALFFGLIGIRGGASGFVLGAAALVKPSALAALPGLVRRRGALVAVGPAAAALAILLHPPEGLITYAQYWVFNPALPRLLPDIRWLEVGLPLTAAGAAALWRWRRPGAADTAALRSAYWVLGAFLLTTPMLAPWYLCWILPFAALFEGSFWLLLSISIFLSYHAHLGMTESTAAWLLQFLIPTLGALWFEARRPAWVEP